MKHEFRMKQKLKDTVTGFEGIVLCIAEYHTGCVHYSLQSNALKEDGTPKDWQTFDESRLILVKDVGGGISKKRGGPFPNPPMM